LVGGFRLPSDVCPPSGRLLHLRGTFGAPSGPLRGELGRKLSVLSAFRPPSRFDAGLLGYGTTRHLGPVTLCTFRDRFSRKLRRTMLKTLAVEPDTPN
jgi:hypothetical protein